MNIELHKVTIRELIDGYKDSDEEGVVGFGGKLDIRPKYQRNFVYNTEQERAVITTIKKGFPLNIMYWVKRDDGTLEVLDGQQRILSICHYIAPPQMFSVEDEDLKESLYFDNLPQDIQEKILNYELMVYFCEGNPTEKLAWFQTINIAGLKLTDQELLNAIHASEWLTDAKRYFSKSGCPAQDISNKYVKPRYEVNRQGLLELALLWINDGSKDGLKEYMRQGKHKQNAQLDTAALEKEVTSFMMDEEVTNKKGIYRYVLTRDERHLNIRTFSDNIKREVYERQEGKCYYCGKPCDISEMEGDHILAWSRGGKTVAENCRMACRTCNRTFSNK